MPEELMVATEDIDRLGGRLREAIAKMFGEVAQEVVGSRHEEAYRAIVCSLLAEVKVRAPKQIVRGTLRYGRQEPGGPFGAWVEPTDGMVDFYLSDLGADGELVEIVTLEATPEEG